MNTGFQLYQLQEIDSSIDSSQKRIMEIDRTLEKDDEVIELQNKLIFAESKLKQKKILCDQISLEIESKKIKKNQSESSLYAGTINNPKELQDLQMEIASLGQAISKIEDDLLEKLFDLEEAEAIVNELKEKMTQLQSSFASKKSLLLGERSELENTIKNLNSKKTPIISQIEAAVLTLYNRLRQSKNGVAVAKLQDNSCSSCGYSLTASQCQQARSASQLFFCPSCGRIVYGS